MTPDKKEIARLDGEVARLKNLLKEACGLASSAAWQVENNELRSALHYQNQIIREKAGLQ